MIRFNIMKPMTDETRLNGPIENYPRTTVFFRWLLLLMEAGLALYMVFKFNPLLGIAYLPYSIVCLFVIFPLIRCVRCNYYGLRCNFGWGRSWIFKFFPKEETNNYGAYYGWSILFWPIRVVPVILGIRALPLWITGRFDFMTHGLFLIYLAIIFIHRLYYRGRACPKCRQNKICPVYLGRIPLSQASQ